MRARGPTDEELRQVAHRTEWYLRRHLDDAHAREDLVQETLMRVLHGYHRLREPAALCGWACRIAFHLMVDRRRRPEHALEKAGNFEDPLHDSLAPPADHLRDLGERRRQWLGHLLRSLRDLGPRDRALVIGHYFVGHSYAEMARRTGLSLANVKVRLYRARRRMRRWLPTEEEYSAFQWARSRYEEGRSAPARSPSMRHRS